MFEVNKETAHQEKVVDKYTEVLKTAKYEFEKRQKQDRAKQIDKTLKEVKEMWKSPDHGKKKWIA